LAGVIPSHFALGVTSTRLRFWLPEAQSGKSCRLFPDPLWEYAPRSTVLPLQRCPGFWDQSDPVLSYGSSPSKPAVRIISRLAHLSPAVILMKRRPSQSEGLPTKSPCAGGRPASTRCHRRPEPRPPVSGVSAVYPRELPLGQDSFAGFGCNGLVTTLEPERWVWCLWFTMAATEEAYF
jgi:hypothetical protein